MPVRNASAPRLGGKIAVILFAFALLSFVIESQLTQYVQTTLEYRQPFFLFYVVHSTFGIIFPLHFAYLVLFTKNSPSSLCESLSIAITNHLSPSEAPGSTKFPRSQYLRLTLALTLGITYPSLLWFSAVSLAPISDVTAIWNTNAFFAYILTVKLFELKWEPRRLLAVLLASLGVLAVVYGGSTSDSGGPVLSPQESANTPSAPLIGDLLTLIASIGYGFYQVAYKKYAALSTDPEVISEHYYNPVPVDAPADGPYNASVNTTARGNVVKPPPFGLHANLLTSTIGLLTFILLWILIPVLHYLGVEHFVLPPNLKTILAIAGIALSGVVFNAGFMVLLGVWGPIVTSVGNLLTIVLVFISDVIFGVGLEALTFWSMIGCSIIVVAFSVLAYDMFDRGS